MFSVAPPMSSKLELSSRACVFLGYDVHHHAYTCLDPITNKIFVSCHVRFIEGVFPFSIGQSISPSSAPIFPILPPSLAPASSASAAVSQAQPALAPSTPNFVSPSSPSVLTSPTVSAIPSPLHITSDSPSPPSPPQNRHPMITRSKNNIFRPKQIHSIMTHHPTPSSAEPTCVS